MTIRLFFFLIFLIFNISGYCQSELDQKLEAILQSPTFDYASVGLSVRSMDGDVIVNLDADKKYIPASSLKLITTLLTIEEFGEAFQFTTRIGYSGKVDRSGTLNGNLIIIGSGDPTLGADRYGEKFAWDSILAKIIASIQDAGIKCIDGKIEIKTNVFQGQAICPSWPYSDIANYYGSGAWGLNFNENKYDLFFSAKIPEESVATLERISPEIPNMYFQSEVIVKGSKTGDNAYIYGDPFNYSKIVRGSIPYSEKPFKIKGAIPNPPLSFGYLLEHALANKGIRSNGSIVSKDPIKRSEFVQLLSFKSPSMSRIVQEANYESINLYCEALLRMLGRKTKQEGSFEAGLEYVSETLENKGIPKNSFNINDGGGLSPRNGISPASFTQFLCGQYEILGKDKLEKYIPHVGVSGTVKSLMGGKSGQKEFYLKSGSMGGVLTYTGFFKSKSGKMYSVSFMSNNHSKGNRSVRNKVEKVFEILYDCL
jgi:D-alanyl-D-alanine carboxypeptidase/D-alanyl-D-alanine-endopeptidase (penicillin-binding protein 4)